MDSFFNLIFENFFIVIIIVVAIFNFLSKAKKDSEPQEQQSEPTREKPKRSIQDLIEEKAEQVRDSYQQTRETVEDEAQKGKNLFEEQRQKQYEQLRNQMQSTQPKENQEKETFPKNKFSEKSLKERTESDGISINRNIKRKLTKQGLAESIVMAEVLGPPRALNPYQNVAMKRKGK